MRESLASRAVGAIAGIITSTLVLLSPTVAQVSEETQPAVRQLIQTFRAGPGEFVQRYPDGGAQLISAIRDIATADPAALPLIIAQLAKANSNQQMAIGSALGQAAQAAVRSNQAYANEIQQALATSGIENAIVAFSAVTGNFPIASTAGGGGGGGGAGGPTSTGVLLGGGNTGVAQTFGGTHFSTVTTTNFSGLSTAGGISAPSGGPTTLSGSVSPH